MLTQVRNSVKGIGAWIVVALMVLAFGLFGVPDLQNFAQSAALKVGNQKYTSVDIQQEFNLVYERARRDNPNMTRKEAVESGLMNSAINTLTTRGSFASDAKALGVTSTKEMVTDYLQSIEGLKNPTTGKFDQTVLSQILQANRTNVVEFRSNVRSDLVRSQVVTSVAAPITTPDIFIDSILLREAETRSVKYLTLGFDNVEAPAEPTQDDLQKYYNDNPALYTTPEYRVFSAVILKRDDFQSNVSVSDDDIQKLFQSRKSRLDVPEKRSFSQITFKTQTEAEAALAQLQTGSSFEDLAARQSLSVASVNLVDQARADVVDPQIADAIFAAEQDALIGPLSGIFGFTVARVSSITEGREAVLEEERENLISELQERDLSRQLQDALEEIETGMDEGLSIAEAVRAVEGAEMVTYGPVDRNLMTPENAIVNNLPVEVVNEAFTINPGEESDVVELQDNNGYFLLVVEDSIAPALKPLGDVQNDVKSRWTAAQKSSALLAKKDALKAKAQQSASLVNTSVEEALNVQSASFRRSAPPVGLPAELITDAFNAELGEIVEYTSADGTAIFLLQVTDTTFPEMPQADLMKQLFKAQAGRLLSDELLDAYLTSVQDEIGVKQNDAQISQLLRIE